MLFKYYELEAEHKKLLEKRKREIYFEMYGNMAKNYFNLHKKLERNRIAFFRKKEKTILASLLHRYRHHRRRKKRIRKKIPRKAIDLVDGLERWKFFVGADYVQAGRKKRVLAVSQNRRKNKRVSNSAPTPLGLKLPDPVREKRLLLEFKEKAELKTPSLSSSDESSSDYNYDEDQILAKKDEAINYYSKLFEEREQKANSIKRKVARVSSKNKAGSKRFWKGLNDSDMVSHRKSNSLSFLSPFRRRSPTGSPINLVDFGPVRRPIAGRKDINPLDIFPSRVQQREDRKDQKKKEEQKAKTLSLERKMLAASVTNAKPSVASLSFEDYLREIKNLQQLKHKELLTQFEPCIQPPDPTELSPESEPIAKPAWVGGSRFPNYQPVLQNSNHVRFSSAKLKILSLFRKKKINGLKLYTLQNLYSLKKTREITGKREGSEKCPKWWKGVILTKYEEYILRESLEYFVDMFTQKPSEGKSVVGKSSSFKDLLSAFDQHSSTKDIPTETPSPSLSPTNSEEPSTPEEEEKEPEVAVPVEELSDLSSLEDTEDASSDGDGSSDSFDEIVQSIKDSTPSSANEEIEEIPDEILEEISGQLKIKPVDEELDVESGLSEMSGFSDSASDGSGDSMEELAHMMQE